MIYVRVMWVDRRTIFVDRMQFDVIIAHNAVLLLKRYGTFPTWTIYAYFTSLSRVKNSRFLTRVKNSQ